MNGGFIGQTRSGKTTLATVVADGLRRRGRRLAVLDRMRDPRWGRVEFICSDADEFMSWCQAPANAGCHLFCDEWGITCGRQPRFDWFGTSARHHGHSVWFVAHRWTQLSPAIRDSIDVTWAFGQGVKSASLLAEEFAAPELITLLPKMQRGKFMQVGRFADARPGTIDIPRRRVRWGKAA